MAYDIARGQTIVFGGQPGAPAGPQPISDTWSFDGTDWTQVEDIGPSPRTSHAAAYDSDRQRLVLFSGSFCEPE